MPFFIQPGCVRKWVSLVLLVGWMFTACSPGRTENAVAIFGDSVITANQFKDSYYQYVQNPQVFDSREQRERFLDELINRRLLAEEGRKSGLAKDEKFQLKTQAFKRTCLKDEHFQKTINPLIEIDDALVREVQSYLDQERHLQHLYTETLTDAEALHNALLAGANFDSLAAATFSHPVMRERQGDMGWVFWDQMEFDFAMAAFRMQVGEFSEPVKSSFGYHIVKVLDFRVNPFNSPNDLQIDEFQVTNLVRMKIGDKIAYDYIEKMMRHITVDLETDPMQAVSDVFSEVYYSKDPGKDDVAVEDSQAEVDVINDSLWDQRNEVLMFINDRPVTVGEFVSYMPYIPAEAIQKGLRSAVDYAIRDFQLAYEAVEAGLEKSPVVQSRAGIFEEYLLQLNVRKQIINSTALTEAEIKKAYTDNVIENISSKPYEEVSEVLYEYLDKLRRAEVVPARIEALKAGLNIEKNLDLLHQTIDRLYSREESES